MGRYQLGGHEKQVQRLRQRIFTAARTGTGQGQEPAEDDAAFASEHAGQRAAGARSSMLAARPLGSTGRQLCATPGEGRVGRLGCIEGFVVLGPPVRSSGCSSAGRPVGNSARWDTDGGGIVPRSPMMVWVSS